MAAAALHLPPYRVFPDFLGEAEFASLWSFAMQNENQFRPTKIRRGDVETVEPTIRISQVLKNLGPFRNDWESRLLTLTGQLIADLRVSPFDPAGLELELVAHGDGAFYRRHIDTFTGPDDPKRLRTRVLSGVYYFHRSPKSFSGGQLRLHAFGAAADDNMFIDIEPTLNSLLVFPSWASHEVLKVSCPSGRFEDNRFAVNCWFYRDNTHAAA